MLRILKAEHLKMKRTFARTLPFVAPCMILLLALLMTAGQSNAYAAGAFNWWYAMFLPGSLAIGCDLLIKKDKKSKYRNILLLDIPPALSFLGKILYCAFGLLIANIVILLGSCVGGFLLGTTISVPRAIAGAVLLTVANLWEIPLLLLISDKMGMFASIISSLLLTISAVVAVADGAFWWCYPPAIPARLMCPVLGVMPNGLQVPAGSELLSGSVILPGILLSFLWFALLTLLTCRRFNRTEGK